MRIIFILFFSISVWADLTPQRYTNQVPSTFFTHLDFKNTTPFNRKSFKLWDQSQEWQSEMVALGQRLTQAKVKTVYFVHGTFAGNDPVGIISCIKLVYPDLSPTLEAKLRDILKKNNDKLLKDTGNYLPEYVSLFKQAIGGQIPCHLFNWSSRNHHIARLRGAVKLAHTLANRHQGEERILLIGHSHAGQLFALLSNFLEKSRGLDTLYGILQEDGVDIEKLKDSLVKVRQMKLDFATFGTPPRYGWGNNVRLLNVINHRGKDHLAGSILGLLVTKDGDYVQQWGIAGTDLRASTSKERALNKRLDEILGTGKDVSVWLKNIKPKMRVAQYGKTFLVNYKDGNKLLPNVVTTFFGHGVYTKFDTMLFNTRLIANTFYR